MAAKRDSYPKNRLAHVATGIRWAQRIKAETGLKAHAKEVYPGQQVVYVIDPERNEFIAFYSDIPIRKWLARRAEAVRETDGANYTRGSGSSPGKLSEVIDHDGAELTIR